MADREINNPFGAGGLVAPTTDAAVQDNLPVAPDEFVANGTIAFGNVVCFDPAATLQNVGRVIAAPITVSNVLDNFVVGVALSSAVAGQAVRVSVAGIARVTNDAAGALLQGSPLMRSTTVVGAVRSANVTAAVAALRPIGMALTAAAPSVTFLAWMRPVPTVGV